MDFYNKKNQIRLSVSEISLRINPLVIFQNNILSKNLLLLQQSYYDIKH